MSAPWVGKAGEGGEFGGVTRLGLYDAFVMALAGHESVGMARESMTQSEFDIDKAYSYVLPTLDLESTYTRYSEEKGSEMFLLQPEDSTRFEARLTQPLYSGGRAKSGIRQARKRLAGSRSGLEEARENVIMDTARAYYGALKAAREVEIKEASLKRARERLRVSEARFRVGSATRAQVLRDEAEAAGAEAELTRAAALLRDGEDEIRRLTGVTGPMEIFRPETNEGGIDMGVNELIGLSLRHRKDYMRKLIDEEVAAEGINYVKGHFRPSLKLEGVYTYREQTPSTPFLLNDVAYAGLTIEFPIFEGGLRRAELGEARSKLREAELARLALRRDIELQVRRSYNKMGSAASVMDSYEKQLSFSEENYSMVFKQYTHGLADTMDVIDAGTTLVEAQTGLMGATYDYELALIEVKKSAGILLDEVSKVLALKKPTEAELK